MRSAILALLAIVVLAGCEPKTEQKAAGSGHPAPELVATKPDGAVVRLNDLRGKVVLINFWLVECGPCLAEMPGLNAFYRANRGRGLEVLAINMGASKGEVSRFGQSLNISFPLLLDPLKITQDRYKVSAAPTFFIIDRTGAVVERIDGPLDEAALQAKVGRLL